VSAASVVIDLQFPPKKNGQFLDQMRELSALQGILCNVDLVSHLVPLIVVVLVDLVWSASQFLIKVFFQAQC
jgi:hypothetical protein